MKDTGAFVSSWRIRASDRALVVGANSLVGGNLAISLTQRLQVDALVEQPTVRLTGCHAICCDPSDRNRLIEIVKRRKPIWIVLCGPLARSSWDPPACLDAEKELCECRWWARLTDRLGIRLTMLSSDTVFTGPRMFHTEESPTTAKGAFSLAVRRAEDFLQSTGALVVRTHAFGWSLPGIESGVIERVWENLIEADGYRSETHRHATPILVDDLAELLWVSHARNLRGLYHIAGAERVSLARFADQLASVFGLTTERDLRPSCTIETPPPTSHSVETSLATLRARRALERPMPMLRDGLARLARQPHQSIATPSFAKKGERLASWDAANVPTSTLG